FFFSSRRRHTRSKRDWSSDVCSSDLILVELVGQQFGFVAGKGPGGVLVSLQMPHEPGGDVAVGGVQHLAVAHAGAAGHRLGGVRSEERRVGKEGRCRWSREHWMRRER